ncbi:hypothetical protein [Streptacidiphilus jiangxiensis]|uniref:DUF3618 domain-containing protein n=1 Tax=Streptacidiphilus jiangxiensis TaxID=235985 RepID=A0A1H7MYB6_STRJI|nr:hypothetical protein [Streptacidiphilus jiangxiensis]SEL15637.1 hypothetical protein SAMN05414137_106105 [Streptacidiphilus jiangxiensis]
MSNDDTTRTRLLAVAHAAADSVEAARSHLGHSAGSARSAAGHVRDSVGHAAAAQARRASGSLTARTKDVPATGRAWPTTVVLGTAAAAALGIVVRRLTRSPEPTTFVHRNTTRPPA